MAATYVETNKNRMIQEDGQTALLGRISEAFWGVICLVLFMVLGPFAAPIAVGVLFCSQASGEDVPEPSPVHG